MSDTSASRRAWLRGLVPNAARTVAGVKAVAEAAATPQRRPPGALNEVEFLATCTRCDECVNACPHAAIFVFGKDTGQLARTPVMAPDQRACHMCEGFPCATACGEGALIAPTSDDVAAANENVSLGTVEIDETSCIAHLGPECGACANVCPPGLSAITLVRWRPRVNSNECIGCGLCIEACPTSPKAIRCRPLE